mgnify:CR=1 FL=1|eukprot:scaffold220951_cov32-Tisochrysis_lutea.AAC.3
MYPALAPFYGRSVPCTPHLPFALPQAREIAAKQIGSESAQLLSVAVLYFGVASPGAKPVSLKHPEYCRA